MRRKWGKTTFLHYLLTDAEKAFDMISYPFSIKTVKLGIEKMYLNILNATYGKPTDNVRLSDERSKGFPLR